jgi:hypothetical protein
MSDQQANAKKADKVTAKPKSFESDGLTFPGVHELGIVSLKGMQEEFGEKTGREMYRKVVGVRGGSIFFNPKIEATDYTPNVNISKQHKDVLAEISEILNAKE